MKLEMTKLVSFFQQVKQFHSVSVICCCVTIE